MKTLGNIKTTRHAYECETESGPVTVYANNRDQAARIALARIDGVPAGNR